MKPFKVIKRETLLDNPYCPTEKHVVELPDGTTTDWYVNTSRDAVIVIPILESGEVVLQKAYKHGGGEVVTEFCAGLVDAGETPEDAAHRELEEETGYQTKEIKKLGEIFANPTGSQMKYHIFQAKACTPTGTQNFDPAEQIEIFTVPSIQEAQELLTSTKTRTSAATLAALSLV